MHELDLQFTGLEPRPSPPALSGNGRTATGVVENVLPEAVDEALRILVWMPGSGDTAALQAYGAYLTGLLHGQASYQLGPEASRSSQLDQALRTSDLLIFGEPDQSVTKRVLYGSAGNRAARKASSTILVARQPLHPFRKILLIVRVEAFEGSAVAWAGCLAQASGAQLTILSLVPAQPSMYGPGSRLQIGIDSLLTPNTHCGEQLRRFLNQLEQWHVDGTLRVRQGDPLWQICWEIDEGQYDLVIIGAEQHRHLERLLFGELVGPLLSRVNRPLLIAAAKQPTSLHPPRTQIEEPGVI